MPGEFLDSREELSGVNTDAANFKGGKNSGLHIFPRGENSPK